MSEVLTSNITVEFSSDDAERKLKIEADDRDPSLRTQYLRVFPSNTGIIFATTGSIVRAGTDVAEVDEILSFNNSREAALTYPEGYTISKELLGAFYDSEGNRQYVNITYEASSNSLTIPEKGFGLVRVQYKSKYTLYRFKYNGWGCPYEEDFSGPPNLQNPYTPFGDDVEEYIPYDDSMVIVYESERGDYASINLTGPDCKTTSGTVDRDSGPGDLVVEVDPEGPVSLIPAYTYDPTLGRSVNVEATAVLRVYPDVSGDLTTTSGAIQNGTRGFSDSKTEVLKFKFSNGTNFKYPPSGRASITPLSTFTDQWDRPKNVQFHQEGDTVIEVKWIGEDYFEGNPVERVVQPGEIVVTNTAGRIIKATGEASAVYGTTYSKHPFIFTPLYNSSQQIAKFQDAHVRVVYQKPPYISNLKQSGSISLKGPSVKGVDEYKAPDG